MPISGHKARLHSAKRNTSLLARYSETLGEMMLRKHTEIAIRAARVEAELNSRSKSAFLSTMSHELRTPLNAIIGFSDLLQAPGSPAESLEYAGYIAQAGRRLLDVVGDVLDISKLESGSLTLSRAPVLISEVIEEAVEQVRPQIDEKKQNIDVHCDRAVSEMEIDHKRIRQVLVHLISNASKFTSQAGRILVMARDGNNGEVTIAVADTGIGMTHEEIVLALKPFAQVDARRTRTQEGAGLGLPLSLGLARLHGGMLHIESQPGSGTTVLLTLPRFNGEAAKVTKRGKAA